MGISERKEREKQEMRDLILVESTRMFIEEGYEKTSIRNIADRIEYSPATIYLYYKDKDAILYDIHEQGFEKLSEKLSGMAKIQNPYERLLQMGHLYLQFAFENPEYYDLMFIMRAPMKKLNEEKEWSCGFDNYYFLQDVVKECINAGYLKPIDSELASFSIWSFMHGMVSLAIRERFKMYSEEQVKQLMHDSVRMIVGMMAK
ncbi:MAG: TetR/AcrR family transcriptional regulator [Bacteroidota bacterium]